MLGATGFDTRVRLAVVTGLGLGQPVGTRVCRQTPRARVPTGPHARVSVVTTAAPGRYDQVAATYPTP
ncbi:hypothetical protein KE639_05490 [Streptomyces sp. V17-9]|nr:hypothetical protein KE639_05490 [Streptomyces sp. V17-9]